MSPSRRGGRVPAFLRRWWQRLRFAATGRLLCDTCRFDYRGACARPERPNARTCPDYEHAGRRS